MTCTDPAAASDVAHPQQQLEATSSNYESAQTNLLADHLALEIDRAPTKHLDYLARQVWAAHASGAIDDDAAQGLAELLRDRQRGKPDFRPPGVSILLTPRRRPPRSPDRQRSLEWRRRLSAAGMNAAGARLQVDG